MDASTDKEIGFVIRSTYQKNFFILWGSLLPILSAVFYASHVLITLRNAFLLSKPEFHRVHFYALISSCETFLLLALNLLSISW